MGIFVNLAISKSVTKEEWEKVYEETLQLIKHFPLAEKRKVNIHGIDTICLVKTEERERPFGWKNKDGSLGWDTVGDFTYMRTGEEYYLPRNLVGENEVEPHAGDALLGVLPVYMSYNVREDRFNHIYEIWGAKTQGEPYHYYLLAVAALIEARLGEKAFTYGDIYRNQFEEAVEIANQYLDEKIDLPDRCYMDRLLKRVVKLPLPEDEQIGVFVQFYNGRKGTEFGDCLRQAFSNEATEIYWKREFASHEISSYWQDSLLKDYLRWGFDLDKLGAYANLSEEEVNKKYSEFLEEKKEDERYSEKKKKEAPQETYDITDYADLIYYEPGNTMYPAMMKSIGKSRQFLDSLLKKSEYHFLMERDAAFKCRWLVEQNRCLLIRDMDWEKVFQDIENRAESFSRYYPLFCVKMDCDELVDMCKAFMINDDFYSYSAKLAEQMTEE